MKKLIIAASLVLLFGFLHSQNPLPVGGNQLNIGVGLSDWGTPIYIGIDHGVHKNITLGGEISFRTYHEHWRSFYYSHNIIGVSGNANYHFNTLLKIPQKWDFYAGLNIGFFIWASPHSYDGNHNSGLDIGAQIGCRYYLSEKLGINLELGGGSTLFGEKVGITVKL